MKTLFKLNLCLLLLLAFSCKKEEVSSTTSNNPSNGPTSGFKWTENGGAENIADSSRFTAQYKTLFAWKGTKKFEINLNASSVATYTIGNGNALAFVSSGLHSATTGSIIVTANSGSKISGTFDVTMNSGGFTNIKGTFTDINIK
jgi:hypothetical protein